MHLSSLLRQLRLLTLFVLLAALAGCFGEGDGQKRVPGNPQPTITGVFVDSPVEGATWRASGGTTGLTSASGEFQYLPTEIITFSIGGIVLGSAPGAPFVTSVELTASVDPTDRAALNQLVFLQSIDADRDPSNGISISASTLSAAENQTLDFSAADFPTAVRAVVAAISGNAVVSESAALNHFYTTYAALGGTDAFSFLFPGFAPVGGGVVFELVFADEFDEGSSPATDKWTIETGYGPNNDGNGNNEWQLYTDSPDNVRVENGNLVLSALCDAPCGVRDGSVTSGKVNTLDKFEFKYGKVIARIKVPVGEAAWPAFWSLGANFPDVGWPRSGEIDFMEAHNFFSDENTTHFTMHWCEDSIQAPVSCSFPEGWVFDSQNRALASSLGDDFHIFEADWNAERIIGKIDGVSFFEKAINPATMEEFQRDFFLILNVAMGGTLGSNSQPPNGTETFPQTMLVDYVRVFQGEDDDPGGGDGPGSNLSQINLPITFQAQTVDYTLTDFGEPVPVVTTLIVDPQSSSNNVASTTKPVGAPVGAGTTMSTPAGFASAIPFTATNTTIGIRVFSPDAGIPVRLKADDVVGGSVSVETELLTTVANQWETLVFDFSDQVEGTSPLDLDTSYFALSVFFNFGTDGDTAGEKTYLWDDVRFGVPLPDRIAPVLTAVTIASGNANSTLAAVGNVVTVTLTADEPISAPMVTIGGAPADTVTGSLRNWQASRIVTATDAEGAIAFSIDFADLEGNAAVPVSMTTDGSIVVVDATPPMLAISSALASFTTLDPISITFEFSEPVSNFAANDIQTTNGLVAAPIAGSGTSYTANITPNGLGDLIMMVAPGAALDGAGNANAMAAALTIVNDLDPDTPLLSVVSLFSDNANPAYARTGDVVNIAMTASVDILEPNVTIGGAPADLVTGDGTMWQASRTIVATDAEGLIAFAINFESLAGNPGQQTTAATTGSVTVDSTEPAVSIDGIPATVLTLDPITVTFQFDEDVEAFEVADIGVTNGSAGAFVGIDPATYTADITPDGAGDLTVMLAAGAATDLAGNGNAAVSETATVDLQTFWQLIWSDDFDGAALNSDWTPRTDLDCPAPCSLDGQSSYRPENVSVAGGFVSLAARDDLARGGANYTGSLIDTRGALAFKYGRIEIDALMPATLGAAPSLRLLPATDVYGPWPLSGEIDVVNAPDLGVGGMENLQHTLRYGMPLPEDTTTTVTYPGANAPDVNVLTYALEWEAGEIRWFVDGIHVATQTQDNWYSYSPENADGEYSAGVDGVFAQGAGSAPFDQDFYLVMSLAVGDNADFSSVFPQTLQVDAVRVYKCANPVDPAAGTGCSTGTGVAAEIALDAPYTEMLEVYTDAPAVLSFDVGGTMYTNTLDPGFAQTPPAMVITSNIAFQDGANTAWRAVIQANTGGSGEVFMASEDLSGSAVLDTGFDLTGGGAGGELLFDMRVNLASPGTILSARLDSDAGNGGKVSLPLPPDSEWRTYSVKIADLVANPVGTGLDLTNVINLFAIEATAGTVELDVDNLRVKVACRDTGACQTAARIRTFTEEYSQDLEALDIMSTSALSDDGWRVFGSVFDNATGNFLYGYGAFAAPNGGPGFSAIDTGQGGADQGVQQLSIYNDYNNQDHGNNRTIEASVFRERSITADDIGKTVIFSFDAKLNNLEGSSTAEAFIKTLNPMQNFSQTNLVVEVTTTIPATWGSFSISLPLTDPLLVGQLLQYGFASRATNFEGSGVFYDNLLFGAEVETR